MSERRLSDQVVHGHGPYGPGVNDHRKEADRMSERRHSDFYAEMRQQEGRTVTFYTKRFTDAEVLAEMGDLALLDELERRGWCLRIGDGPVRWEATVIVVGKDKWRKER